MPRSYYIKTPTRFDDMLPLRALHDIDIKPTPIYIYVIQVLLNFILVLARLMVMFFFLVRSGTLLRRVSL